MTAVRRKSSRLPAQEGFIPAGRVALLVFLLGILALLLVAGWLSRLA